MEWIQIKSNLKLSKTNFKHVFFRLSFSRLFCGQTEIHIYRQTSYQHAAPRRAGCMKIQKMNFWWNDIHMWSMQTLNIKYTLLFIHLFERFENNANFKFFKKLHFHVLKKNWHQVTKVFLFKCAFEHPIAYFKLIQDKWRWFLSLSRGGVSKHSCFSLFRNDF